MAYSRETFYEKFKWDSVFTPVYKLVSIESDGEHPIATVTMRSPKLEFLHNNPMTCRYTVYFKNDKIARIEDLDCPTANWELWGKEVDALVGWIAMNHPELDGFIYDLTMQGAIHYMKAITLYRNRKNARSRLAFKSACSGLILLSCSFVSTTSKVFTFSSHISD